MRADWHEKCTGVLGAPSRCALEPLRLSCHFPGDRALPSGAGFRRHEGWRDETNSSLVCPLVRGTALHIRRQSGMSLVWAWEGRYHWLQGWGQCQDPWLLGNLHRRAQFRIPKECRHPALGAGCWGSNPPRPVSEGGLRALWLLGLGGFSYICVVSLPPPSTWTLCLSYSPAAFFWRVRGKWRCS